MKFDWIETRRVLAWILWIATAVLIFDTYFFGWFLRDGLGPDAVESHGMIALHRFWDQCKTLVILTAIVCGAGIVIHPRKHR